MAASLIWAGNVTSGFDALLTCSSEPFGLCDADIVVDFAQAQRSAAFDYPGNVRAVWRTPDGTEVHDTGSVSGSETNFLGLRSDAPIGSLTLIRSPTNMISALFFANCTSTCGPDGDACF